ADDQYPGLRFIGVNLNDSPERAAEFAAEFGAEFETFFDRDGRLTSAMGVATAPVTLLIDAGGVVRRQITGEVTAMMLDEAIAEVFPS
ncbi:MAG: TlpA family protein disulfide reductase, partial [Ilumatobacteraceae bacterium]